MPGCRPSCWSSLGTLALLNLWVAPLRQRAKMATLAGPEELSMGVRNALLSRWILSDTFDSYAPIARL
jgi:hypothetical protein